MATNAKRLAAEALLGAFPQPAGEACWARDARAEARQRLLEAGAPARRDEYWRMTDPAALTAPAAPIAEASEAAEGVPAFPEVSARLARFVNGRFRGDLSGDLDMAGLTVGRLSTALGQDIGLARELFGTLEAAGQEKVARPLASLNTATAADGMVLHASGKVADPVHLHADKVGDGASLLHHVIRVETGAELTVIESGFADNVVMEVDVAPGGLFHHLRVQTGARAPSAGHLFIRIGEEAHAKTFTLTADGELTRNEVVTELTGANGSSHIAGAVLGQGNSHIDNTVFVTHTGTDCESRQVFKSVLADQATGIFQGKIFVRQSAQKTDGYQISQSVLLTEGAEFSAKPELEIYADDVACSHGSTTGALDDTALFYLRSRGISKPEAEAMLISSFVEDAIAEIADDRLAHAMRAEVARWMAARS